MLPARTPLTQRAVLVGAFRGIEPATALLLPLRRQRISIHPRASSFPPLLLLPKAESRSRRVTLSARVFPAANYTRRAGAWEAPTALRVETRRGRQAILVG